MKHLFLDMDGVVNTREVIRKGAFDPWWAAVCPERVQLLNRIVEETGCTVILSSSWRHMQDGLRKTESVLQAAGATFGLEDETPMLGERGDEIHRWLIQHNAKEEDCVILDDDAHDMGRMLPRLVKTSMEHGLTEELATKAIQLLQA